MAGTSRSSGRISVITDAHARPINARELEVTQQLIVTALRGSWGTGDWSGAGDSSWPSGTGNWEKHADSWSATLTTTLSGEATVTFPYPVIRSIVKVWKVSDDGSATLNAYSIESGRTLSITHVGKVVIELDMVHNTKEVL